MIYSSHYRPYIAVSLVVFMLLAVSSTIVDFDEDLRERLLETADGKGLSHYILPLDLEYDKIPQDPKNPINDFKVLLGKKLFCEPGLAIKPKHFSSKKTYSCASCHIPSAGFSAAIKQGIGEGGTGFGKVGEARRPLADYEVTDMDIQPIKSPSVLNGAYNRTAIWNGQFGAKGLNEGTEEMWKEGTPIAKNNLGYEGLETQAIAGMDVHRLSVDEDFIKSTYYKHWFDYAFPEIPESERYTNITAGLAIAAFERTALANQAPFQKWLRGENQAMTDEQKQGAMIFFGKGKCNTCHDGPALNSEKFHALGMNDFEEGDEGVILNNLKDFEKAKLGRGGFTQKEEDMYRFKTPQLYNLKDMNFYGHGASFHSIREIVEYKNKAIPENENVPSSQLATDFQPLNLTEEEVTLLTDFLENALYDNKMSRYAPSEVASKLCFPNNDAQTRADLNWEGE